MSVKLTTKLASGAVAAVAALTLPIAAGTATATGAAAPGTSSAAACETWHDENTFGAACGGSHKYRAKALCRNGRIVYGPWKNNWKKSYAYCTSVNSSLRLGTIEYA
ncbi:hypothetical protein [Saccharothrix obliqua]|uniref:hypothetical protein n=1 Tax=Saccharothrix obliqua TaxID=2861747 RepID=UPI001C5FC9A4|nr:hypothetical protein [Saccharothrix obliqua]MBW4722055.1 hypothetical protein [Saccharothrix obliqua]